MFGTRGWPICCAATPARCARDTALTVRVYRAAVEAGATELWARLADALGAAGDCAPAALADDLLGSDDPAERAAAVRVAAGVAAHDGNLTQAAELFSWLGPDSDAAVSGGRGRIDRDRRRGGRAGGVGHRQRGRPPPPRGPPAAWPTGCCSPGEPVSDRGGQAGQAMASTIRPVW